MDLKIKIGLFVVGGLVLIRLIRKATTDDNTSFNICSENLNNTTYPQYVYDQFADVFETAVWNSFDGMTEDDLTMFQVLNSMQTDDDLAKLICSYGDRVRQRWDYDITNTPMNLIDTTSEFLDDHYKKELNKNYEGRGMISKIY